MKELRVSAIENGTVIDHIPAKSVMKVVKILDLENSENTVLIGANLDSKKLVKKGIIKVSNKFFKAHEINKISLVAPEASLTIIKNFNVKEKTIVKVPKQISGIVKCRNSKCITNHENIETVFNVVTDCESLKLKCKYCEKIAEKDEIEFL